MGSHYRTLTVVVQIPENTPLGGPGFALETAHQALKNAGFKVMHCRNEHNHTGELPPRPIER